MAQDSPERARSCLGRARRVGRRRNRRRRKERTYRDTERVLLYVEALAAPRVSPANLFDLRARIRNTVDDQPRVSWRLFRLIDQTRGFRGDPAWNLDISGVELSFDKGSRIGTEFGMSFGG